MSTESVDPELIEQTKQQIRNLVREIAQLSRSQLAPVEFYDALLTRVVTALAAVGGAIWTLSEGRLELEYQVNLRETGLIESPENQNRHARLLRRVLASGEGFLAAPQSGSLGEDEAANPTDFLLVLGPLKADQDTQGILEIFQRPGASPNVQRGYLRFLLQICELASDYLKTRQLRHYTDRQSLWGQLENFTRVAHRSLDPLTTAYTIANEGRRLIECDRVSVAISKGRKCTIQAVSGQDTFDKRSNTVSMLGRLATAVVATGEPVWYMGDTSDMAPQVEDAVQEYVDESHSKLVGIIPLLKPVEDAPGTVERSKAEPPQVLGALIIEQIEDANPRDGMMQRVEVVREHSAAALSNALEYHNLFLLPVWRLLGRAKWLIRARTLPKTLSVLTAVVALVLALILWPADFELHCTGILQPSTRRDVFASHEGQVLKVPVKNGEHVKAGQVLANLHNHDLDIELIALMGEREKTEQEIRSNLRVRDQEAKTLTNVQRLEIETKLLSLQKTQQTQIQRIKLLEEKKQLLTVRSPIDGQVDTWEVRQRLIGRRVQPDQVLMRVVDPAGPWELELHMPEDDMGHVSLARKKLGDELGVTYIIATDPGAEHEGRIAEVAGSAEVKGDKGNIVLMRVAIDKKDLPSLRPGATVTAKVYCGRAPIGYVYLHDLVAFFQSKILFRL